MATWEWLANISIQKTLQVQKTASRTAGVYGPTYVEDNETPEVTVSLEATCLTATERAALVTTAMTRDGILTVVDNAGTTWSGRVVALNTERIRGTDLYRANVTLRPTDDEV